MDLKENLRRERLAHHLTLEQVGQAIGVSRQTVLRYESGVIANPPAEKIEGLAALFHTTPARLMGWHEPARPQAAFFGGEKDGPDRQADLALLASLDASSELLAIWTDLDDRERQSLLQFARFLKKGEKAP